MTQTLTFNDVLNAIEKNGLTHIHGLWANNVDGNVGGCALSQAAYNLYGLDPDASQIEDKAHVLYDKLFDLGGFLSGEVVADILGFNDRPLIPFTGEMYDNNDTVTKQYRQWVINPANYLTLAEIAQKMREKYPMLLENTIEI